MKEKVITKKKIIVLLISLLTLACLLVIAGVANPIIVIEDEGLEEVVREKLDRPTGPIYETDLTTITELDASNADIISLQGMERFTRLVDLNLENNYIEDVSPLVDLTMLKTLNLQNNNISDLEDINFQTITHLGLRELSLGNEEDRFNISDIDFLSRLTTLESLDLRNNEIEDLTPLSHLSRLEELDLRNNGISNLDEVNFSQIVHLPLKVLNLRDNVRQAQRLTDISMLRDMRTLVELDLRGNHINDVSPVRFLTNLERLDLRDNRITNLEEINFNEIIHLPLKALSLRHNVYNEQRLSDIQLLEEMVLLEELELRDNHIEDLSPLKDLTHLEILDVRENAFTDIDALSHLINLRELNLRENAIKTIEPLTDLVNLEYLNLHSNDQIETLRPISNLTNLETLIIRHIPIRDDSEVIEKLSNLQRLNALDTGLNKIETKDMFSNLRAQGALQDEVRPITLIHTIEPPVFSHTGGFYDEEFSLELDSEIEGATIYYTLDGSEPSEESNEYNDTDEISLEYQNEDEPVVIRAKVFTDDNNISETLTQTYFVSETIQNRFDLPVISLSTNDEHLFDEEMGIYTDENAGNRGSDWERPIHIDFFEQDGSLGFQQNGGVRIHGGATRSYDQKTLRLNADYEYDTEEKFNYNIFDGLENKVSNEPIDEFKTFLLRNSGNDWASTMFRDAMLQSLVEPLGTMDTQAYRPSIVYINGKYWGIHNIRERYDDYYLAHTYNMPREDVVILQDNGSLDSGNEDGEDHYRQMMEYIRTNGLEKETNYQHIQTLMDTDNFKDYVIAQTFFGNRDWPQGNIRYWRLNTNVYKEDAPVGHDGRWRWMLFDTDFGFGRYPTNEDRFGSQQDYTHNMIQWVMAELDGRQGSSEWPNYLIRSIMANDTFKNDFLARYADLLNSHLDPTVVVRKIDSMQRQIEPEIEKHIHRWEAIESLEAWHSDVEDMRIFAKERPKYVRQHLIDEFELSGLIDLTVNTSTSNAEGYVKINTLTINETLPGFEEGAEWRGVYFKGVPMTVTAIPNPGYVFSHWEGLEEFSTLEQVELAPTKNVSIRPVFIKQ